MCPETIPTRTDPAGPKEAAREPLPSARRSRHALPEARVSQPLEHRSSLDDASHEQRRLPTDAEHYLARPVPVQFLRRLGRLGDVARGVAGAVVPQLGRQPHLQAAIERMLTGGDQPAEVLPADAYRVAVQVVPDDLQLTALLRPRTPGASPAPTLPADVVADAAAVHAASPPAVPPRRLRTAAGSTPSASSSSAAGSGRRRESRA